MKKFTLRIVSAIVCLLFIVPNLTACPNKTPKKHLAIVYAACENNPKATIQGELYKSISDVTSVFGSTMSIFVADSSIYRHYYRQFEAPNVQVSASKLKTISNAYTAEALDALASAVPKANEVDLLGGLHKAARQLLTNMNEGEEAYITIIASGLSTVSPLDFSSTSRRFLFDEPENIVNELKSKDAIPDLSFVKKVTLIGIGDVTGEQDKLSYSQVENLKNIWKAILDESGCREIRFASDICDENGNTGKFTVKTVDVGFDPDPDPETPDYLMTIQFKAFKTEFTTPIDEVKRTLEPYAKLLAKHKSKKLLLAGMTDRYGTDAEGNMKFSLKRAQAIKDIMVKEFGIESERIVTCGLGHETHPYRLRDDNGVELHAENRSTIIVYTDTEAAKLLLSIGIRE